MIDHQPFATNAATLVAGHAQSKPGDQEYARASAWNLRIPSQPAAVIGVRTAEDVRAAIRYAATHDLRVAVRSTGHGAVPIDDSVLLIHTAAMTQCLVHPGERRARIGAGVTWRQVIDAAAVHGLAPVCGAAPEIGAVGYLTGGGIGPTARTFGVSSDYVRAIEVVTGDGEIRQVGPTDHEELFWGLRGGKATLGIVTSVDIDLVELRGFFGGCLWFDAADSARVLSTWAHLLRGLPEQLTTSAAVIRMPAMPGVPAVLAGRQSLAIRLVCIDNPELGTWFLDGLRAAATPLLDDVRERPYTEIGMVHGDPVAPMPVADHAALLADFPVAAINPLFDAIGTTDNPQTVVELRLLGGAIAAEPARPSAFCHRDAAFSLFLSGVAPDPATVSTLDAHADRVFAALEPWTAPGLLANFAASDDPQQIARCYDADTLHWLISLADQYDPDRVLQTGQVARSLPVR